MWERQPEETDKQFKAFKIFRDMETRTYTETAKIYGCNVTNIQKWAWDNDWSKRADAYDRYEDAEMLKAIRRKSVPMVIRQCQIAQKMQLLVAHRLNSMDYNDLKPRDIVDFVNAAMPIEQMFRGIPTDQIAAMNPEDQRNQSIENAKMELEELRLDPGFSRLPEHKLVRMICDEHGLTPLDLGIKPGDVSGLDGVPADALDETDGAAM